MARAVAGVYERRGEAAPLEPTQLARLMLAISAGQRLERALEPEALPATLLAELFAGQTVLRQSVGFERLEAGADESDHVVDHCHCLF